MLPPIQEIVDNFALLDEVDDRFEYLIELGRMMEPLPDAERREANLVPGCQSQVWMVLRFDGSGSQAVLHLRGDSDAHITRGAVALLVALYEGMTAAQALAADPFAVFSAFDFASLLTSKRSNGVRSIIERVRREAKAVAQAA